MLLASEMVISFYILIDKCKANFQMKLLRNDRRTGIPGYQKIEKEWVVVVVWDWGDEANESVGATCSKISSADSEIRSLGKWKAGRRRVRANNRRPHSERGQQTPHFAWMPPVTRTERGTGSFWLSYSQKNLVWFSWLYSFSQKAHLGSTQPTTFK